MELPEEIRIMAEKAASPYTMQQLKTVSKEITRQYKKESGKGRNLICSPVDAAVYSVVRMPATFGAVYSALYHTLECMELNEQCSLLDAGAGTGAGTFAASMLLELSEVTCLEREKSMRELGRSFTDGCRNVLPEITWMDSDIRSGLSNRADIVLSSYVLNEMTETDRITAVRELWAHTNRLLLIIEPGTPQAFSQLLRIRRELCRQGAHIAAPCVHEKECFLDEEDWCHFTVRVQRSKMHRAIKEADVPYEDEKYSFMAFVREKTQPSGVRILRHPVIGKGNIRLKVCTDEGLESVTLTKRDKEAYKTARKASAGDLLRITEKS